MLRYFGMFILWNVAASVAIVLLPPLVGLPVMLALTAAFLWGWLLRSDRPDRRRAELRLRPLRGAALGWTLLAVPVFLAFNWSLGEVYLRLVPVPSDTFDMFEELMDEPLGRLSVCILAVAVAPLLEELVFRGLLQRRMERRWGAAAGLCGTALLFALVHFLPRILPLHFFMGLAFGYAVYATRSVWAGVILHAANNASAVLGLGLQTEPPADLPTLWTTGPTPEWWASLLATFLLGLLLARVARGLWRSGAGARLRHAAADG